MVFNGKYASLWSYFSTDTVLSNASESEIRSIKDRQNEGVFNKLHIAAFVYIFVNIFFVISDLLTGFYAKWAPYSGLNIAAEILFITSSIAIIAALHAIKDKKSDSVATIQLIYYFLIETGILLYFSSDILRGISNVTNAFYNMIILVIFVVYSFKAVAALAAYIFGAGLILLLALQKTFVWTDYQLLLLLFILFFLCANYFRANNTKHLYSLVKLENMKVKFEDLSTKDFLTKLSNRTALGSYVKHQLGRAVGDGKTVALLMLDIDDFKSYNDFYSHLAGDKCLHDIASEMLKLENDKFKAFRYGGEEFLIIGIDVTEAEIKKYATNVLNSVRELKIEREDGTSPLGYVTVSIGCAISRSIETSEFIALLSRADKELYRAKRAGKNCCYFRGVKFGD